MLLTRRLDKRLPRPSVTLLHAALLVAVATMPGCFILGSPGPSAVSQGLRYTADEPEYDEFFAALHELQVQMGSAAEEEAEIRRTLARKIGAPEEVEAEALRTAVTERTKALADTGVRLRLVVDGIDGSEKTQPAASLDVLGSTQDRKAQKVIKAVEQAATSEAELLDRMRGVRAAAEKLRNQAILLESTIDTTFRKQAMKRAEVRKNIEDAQKVIPLMMARAAVVAEAAESMLDYLEQSANTAGGAPAQAPARTSSSDEELDESGVPKIVLEEEPPARPAKRKKPPRAAPRPAPRPAPAPAPAPPSASKDGFEP